MITSRNLLNSSDTVKLLMSLTILVVGVMFHFDEVPIAWGAEPATSEVKAAVLAVCTALVTILSLLPQGMHKITAGLSTFTARLSAAGLAFAAGYNWLYSATEGEIVPYIWYPTFLLVGALVGIVIGFVNSTLTLRDRPPESKMAGEFRRFEELVRYEGTHKDEMLAHAGATEILIAQILLHDSQSREMLEVLKEGPAELSLSPAYIRALSRIAKLSDLFERGSLPPTND